MSGPLTTTIMLIPPCLLSEQCLTHSYNYFGLYYTSGYSFTIQHVCPVFLLSIYGIITAHLYFSSASKHMTQNLPIVTITRVPGLIIWFLSTHSLLLAH